jgi:hypothetical protein
VKKNIFTKAAAAFALSGVLLAQPLYAAPSMKMKIDGVLQDLEAESIVVEDNLMMNVLQLAKNIGVSIKYSDQSNTVTLSDGKKSMVMSVGSDDVTINQQKLKLPTKAIREDRIFYVPARFVCQTFGFSVSWVEKTRTIVVETGRTELSIVNLKDRVNSDTRVFTYKQGLDTAIANNSSIKNLEDSRDLIEENLEQAEEAELEAYYSNNTVGEIQAKRQIKQLEIEEDNLEENKTKLQDAAELTYRSHLSNIMTAELDLRVLEENIELEKINVKNMTIKNQLGMESDFNLNQAKEQLRQYESQKAATEITVKNARETLNMFLSFSKNTDLFIDYDVKYTPIDNAVDRHIAIQLEKDPDYIMEQREIEYAEYVVDTYDELIGESEIQNENELNRVKRKHLDTENKFTQNVYKTYNSLKQLEEQRRQLEVDYQLNKNNYNKAVTSFEAGQSTIYEVQQLKVQLLKNEADLLKHQFDYDTLKFQYSKPYLIQ